MSINDMLRSEFEDGQFFISKSSAVKSYKDAISCFFYGPFYRALSKLSNDDLRLYPDGKDSFYAEKAGEQNYRLYVGVTGCSRTFLLTFTAKRDAKKDGWYINIEHTEHDAAEFGQVHCTDNLIKYVQEWRLRELNAEIEQRQFEIEHIKEKISKGVA